MSASRVHARRAAVWSAVAYERARHGQSAVLAAQRALVELTAVRPGDLGEIYQSEYADAALRVSALRWAAVDMTAPAAAATSTVTGRFTLNTSVGSEPGQTCVVLQDMRQQSPKSTLARRCTFGIVWMASAQALPQGPVMLSVQPLESWRELWVFHQIGGRWIVDVLSPGANDPEEGYIEYAGFAPGVERILLVREVKEGNRFRRWFEEVRLDDLVLVRQASSPELLRDFGRWQDVRWRRQTLALR